jgi:HAMP domain-containing protein
MEKTQRVRVMGWASDHLEALEEGSPWALAEAVEDLSRGPYVLYAGIFDPAGKAVAHTGDDGARLREGTFGFIQILKSGEIRAFATAPPDERPAPLAGLIKTPLEDSPGATFRQRFASVLGDMGNRTEDLVGFVEITLDTAPLDRLAARVMAPMVVLAAVLFLAGLGGMLLVAGRIAAPVRMLAEQADLLAGSPAETDFHKIPRPLDEVGHLVARFSVLAAELERARGGAGGGTRSREQAGRREGGKPGQPSEGR